MSRFWSEVFISATEPSRENMCITTSMKKKIFQTIKLAFLLKKSARKGKILIISLLLVLLHLFDRLIFLINRKFPSDWKFGSVWDKSSKP